MRALMAGWVTCSGGPAEAAEGADGEEGFDLGNLHSKDSFMSGVALIRSDYTHCERSF